MDKLTKKISAYTFELLSGKTKEKEEDKKLLNELVFRYCKKFSEYQIKAIDLKSLEPDVLNRFLSDCVS